MVPAMPLLPLEHLKELVHWPMTSRSLSVSRISLTVQVLMTVTSCIHKVTHLLLLAIVPYGNHGCSGGDTYTALKYVIDNGGIDTESSYSFQAKVIIVHFQYTFKMPLP